VTHYFNYCSNESCPNHVGIASWGDHPPPEGAPLRCPRCGGPIVCTEYDDPVWFINCDEQVVHGRRPDASTRGVVMPNLPYGEHALQLDDDDDTKTYGGEDHPDDRGGHVADLKRDLCLLGFYTSGRFRDVESAHPRLFNAHLMGAVLAFKNHLVAAFDVACAADPTPPADTEALTIETAGPIRYDRSLRAPFGDGFGKIYTYVVGFHTRVRLAQLVATLRSRQWDGGGRHAWKTEASAGAFQPVVQPRHTNAVTALIAAPIQQLLDLPFLSPAAGEPDEPEPGAALADHGLAWIPELEQGLTDLVTACDDLWTDVHAWDTAADGRAVALRAEITRAHADEHARPTRVADLEHRLSSWERFRDAWRDLRNHARALAGRTRAYARANVDAFRAYHDALVHNGTLDVATAIHIRHILMNGTLPTSSGERGVFVCPPEDSLEDATTPEERAALVTRLAERHDIPVPIALEQFNHESGLQQFITLHRGRRIPVYGVDWDNPGCPRHTFHEVVTDPTAWRWSCGWGASQFTTFSARIGDYAYRRGIPLSSDATPPSPDFIRSIEANVDVGVALFRTKFENATQVHPPRDCTFEPRYDCHRCLAPARLGCADEREVAAAIAPLTSDGAATTDPSEAVSFYLRLPADRMLSLFELDAHDAASPRACAERPCSWLAAKMCFGGSGAQAFRRLGESVRHLAAAAPVEDDDATPPTSTEDADANADETSTDASPG
jgi:hypothetical protein